MTKKDNNPEKKLEYFTYEEMLERRKIKEEKLKREKEIFDRYKKSQSTSQNTSQSDQEYYDDLIQKKKKRDTYIDWDLDDFLNPFYLLLTFGLFALGISFLEFAFFKTKDFAFNKYQEFNKDRRTDTSLQNNKSRETSQRNQNNPSSI